jgi:predicted permease
VMALMMMIMFSTPTSAQVLMICTKHQCQEENMSKICLWMYLIAPLPILVFTASSIYIVY